MAKKDCTVSIIIPFYSRCEWLIEAVDSVLDQSYADYELIVIDDGSPEDISAFLKHYGQKIIYHRKENGGPATARNLGINVAKGKYIAFLDSDDIWEKDKLRKQVDFMQKNKAIWSHTSYAIFPEQDSNTILRNIDLSYFQGAVFPHCLASCPIATPCVMIERKFLLDNPGLRFNEAMRYGQDWFLWINLALQLPLFVLPEVLTQVRIRGTNAALRARVQLKARAQIHQYMRTQPKLFFGRDKVKLSLRIAYCMCKNGQVLMDYTENQLKSNAGILELLAKVLYAVPYIIFKTYDRYNFRR